MDKRRLGSLLDPRSLERTMKNIIAKNSEYVTGLVAREQMQSVLSQVSKEGWTTLKVPDAERVLPKVLSERRALVRGKLLSGSLRRQLAQAAKDAIKESGAKRTDRVTKKVADLYRAKVREVFDGYIRKPKIGPSLLQAIANTEMRASINDFRYRYFEEMVRQNPGLVVRKRWVHHPSLSKTPRPYHAALNGREVGMDAVFKVRGGEGYVDMLHPHDPAAGPDQNMNCHCEVQYLARPRGRA